MRTPLFAVGESVILVSSSSPHHNGVHVIRSIHKDGERYIDRVGKKPVVVKLRHDPFAYRLVAILENENQMECLWQESCLRKKYTPGTVSFKRLMELL